MTIKLSSLPKPQVKELLDFETELQKKKDKLKVLKPDWDADVESETSVKLLEVSAYDAVNERQRVNDAAVSVMLPWCRGDDLDNLAARFNLTRHVIQEADDTVSPPIEEIKEADAELQERCLLAWSKLTNAGTPSSYEAHARDAHVKVKAAKAIRVKGGKTRTYVLSHDGDGTPSVEILDAVRSRLNEEDIRQLCSENEVVPAIIQNYAITAVLDISETAVEKAVVAQALLNTQTYVKEAHTLKSYVSKSRIDAEMHIEGVNDVDLGDFQNIKTDKTTAPYCTSITITVKEREDNELITS